MRSRIHILVVEDNLADARLLEIVLAATGPGVTTHLARDGPDALGVLRALGAHADAARPDLVLLDLDLPGMDGREVLRAVKDDPALRAIPVVVCSGTKVPGDVERCYGDRANAFVAKPTSLDGYEAAAEAIVAFWKRTATLPRHAVS